MPIRLVVLRALFIAICALPSTANAQSLVYWSMPAAGCTPDVMALRNDRYNDPSGHRIEFAGDKTGIIRLTCPISPNTGGVAPDRLSVTYRVSVAGPSQPYVRALLVKVNRDDGVMTTIANFNSGNFPQTVRVRNLVPITEALDFDTNYYFVRVEMARNATTEGLNILGLALEKSCVENGGAVSIASQPSINACIDAIMPLAPTRCCVGTFTVVTFDNPLGSNSCVGTCGPQIGIQPQIQSGGPGAAGR